MGTFHSVIMAMRSNAWLSEDSQNGHVYLHVYLHVYSMWENTRNVVFSPGSETPHLGVCALNDIAVRGWKHHNSECMSKSSRCAESTAVTAAKSQKRRIMAGMWPLEFAHPFPSLMTRMYLQGTSTGVTAILLEFSDDFREMKVNSMWSG